MWKGVIKNFLSWCRFQGLEKRKDTAPEVDYVYDLKEISQREKIERKFRYTAGGIKVRLGGNFPLRPITRVDVKTLRAGASFGYSPGNTPDKREKRGRSQRVSRVRLFGV